MDKIIFEKVGQRLKQARESNHITLEEAGKKVDVHKSTVLRWENGETEKIKLPVIESLANLYGVNPVWLMGYDVDMNANTINYNNYNDDEYFSFTIMDDSMKPILYDGDIVIIHKQDNVQNGEFALIAVDDEVANVRKFSKFDDFIELSAFNSYYPTRRIDNSQKVKIIGKVIEGRISKIFKD
ncbi:MAG: helix-turn-helix domain-containing protein [Clostridia bacterium]|jgi:SOS-response transcriptional repressor LexA|nr:helix-turn-helix domain-containing protein [Clostridia bacterium]